MVQRLSICFWNTATHRSLHRNLRTSSSFLGARVSQGSLSPRAWPTWKPFFPALTGSSSVLRSQDQGWVCVPTTPPPSLCVETRKEPHPPLVCLAHLTMAQCCHFECDSRTAHMLIQWCLLLPLTSTVNLSLFKYVHSSPLSLAARLHQYHANCSHYINNDWTFKICSQSVHCS